MTWVGAGSPAPTLYPMKTVLVPSPGKIEIIDCPPLPLHPGEVRVRVAVAGICGSDVHLFKGEHPLTHYPITPGHEFSGTVIETLPGSAFVVGERVAIHPLATCGVCDECLRGRPNYCRQLRVLGVQIQGAFSEQVVLPERTLRRLPATMDFADGAIVEPLAIALHVLKRGWFAAGQSVAIIGSGTIGTLALQVVRSEGASVVFAVDRLDERVELARRFGADLAVNNRRQDAVAAGLELMPDGYDLVLELAGEDETLEQALRLARKGGVVVMIAMPFKRLDLNYLQLYTKELTLRGTRLCTDELDRAIELLANGTVQGKPLITHYFPLADAAHAFDLAANHPEQAVKVMLVN